MPRSLRSQWRSSRRQLDDLTISSEAEPSAREAAGIPAAVELLAYRMLSKEGRARFLRTIDRMADTRTPRGESSPPDWIEPALEEESRPLAGGGRDVADAARDVIELEDSATDASPMSGHVVARLFQDGQEPREVPLSDLPQLVSEDPNFVWVDVSDYSQRDLAEIAGILSLNRAGVRAALSGWQRPRLDAYRSGFFVSVTVPHPDSQRRTVLAGQLNLFVGRNYLVSVHKLVLPFHDRVLARVSHNPEIYELDSAYMLYTILDQLLEYYETLTEHVEFEVELMEDRALSDTSDGFLDDLLHFKRYAFSITQLAAQHRKVFEAFLRPDFPFVSGEDLQAYFRDLTERYARLSDSLSAAKESVTGAFNIYVSHVSHRTNQIIKTLTMVSVLLLPATVILGLFSTNVRGLPIYHSYDYAVVIALILLVNAMSVFVMRRKKWL